MGLRVEIETFLPEAPARALAAALQAGTLPAGAALVKESVRRAVHRATVEGVPLYLKSDRPRGARDRLKFLVLPSRARAERDNLRQLAAAGIPVPAPLALAERRRLGFLDEAVLVTAAIEGAASLWDRMSPDAAAQAGALARRLHDLRCFHRDFHPANILVREGGALALVDLQKLRFLPVLPERLRARDLAIFLYDLTELDDPALRARFLDGYGAGAALRARLDASIAARRAQRMASRSRRCVVRSTGFRIERSGPFKVFRRADVPLEGVLAAVEAHRRTIAAGPGAPGFVKLDPPATSLSRQPPLAPEGPGAAPVAVKAFPDKGLLAGLSNLLRPNRAMAAWLAAHALLVRRIETPLPLALVEVRRLGIVVASSILTRWVEGAEDAHLYIERRFAGGRSTAPPGRARGPFGEGGERAPLGLRGEAAAARALGRFVGRLHAEAIYHGDLKLPNFLVSEPPGGGPPALALLDLDAIVLGRRVTLRRRAKNLAQIEDYARYHLPQVKRTHRARFLEEYLRALGAPDGRGERRRLLALVEEHVQFRWARRERRLARLAAHPSADLPGR